MTGMSSVGIDGVSTQMMKAKNNLKLMSHQQALLGARLMKLNKEKQKADVRIKDAERRAELIFKTNQTKVDRMTYKNQAK